MLAHEIEHSFQYQILGARNFFYGYGLSYLQNRGSGMNHADSYHGIPQEEWAREPQLIFRNFLRQNRDILAKLRTGTPLSSSDLDRVRLFKKASALGPGLHFVEGYLTGCLKMNKESTTFRPGGYLLLSLLLTTCTLIACEPVEVYCPVDWDLSERRFQKASSGFEIETLHLSVGIAQTYFDLSYRITNRSKSTCEIDGLELAGVPPVNPAGYSLEPGEQITIDYGWSFDDRILDRFADGFEVRFKARDCALNDLPVFYERCKG